jgi:hypothetical protein
MSSPEKLRAPAASPPRFCLSLDRRGYFLREWEDHETVASGGFYNLPASAVTMAIEPWRRRGNLEGDPRHADFLVYLDDEIPDFFGPDRALWTSEPFRCTKVGNKWMVAFAESPSTVVSAVNEALGGACHDFFARIAEHPELFPYESLDADDIDVPFALGPGDPEEVDDDEIHPEIVGRLERVISQNNTTIRTLDRLEARIDAILGLLKEEPGEGDFRSGIVHSPTSGRSYHVFRATAGKHGRYGFCPGQWYASPVAGHLSLDGSRGPFLSFEAAYAAVQKASSSSPDPSRN